MGADSSKSSKLVTPCNLDSVEVAKLRKKLKDFCDVKDSIPRQKFVDAFPRLGVIAPLFFDSLSEHGTLPIERIIDALNRIHGDAQEQTEILLKIHKTSRQILADCVTVFGMLHDLSSSKCKIFLDFVSTDLPTDDSQFHKWLLRSLIASQIIRSAYSPVIGKIDPPLIPRLTGKTHLLESMGEVAAINSHLPMERRKEWTLLFSSASGGSSFSKMYKSVNGEGPCVVIVQSMKGNIFGCFASNGFVSGPQYRGDSTCFLFELSPSINIYSATARTSNYAYLNCQQASLPNGLGMGGYEDCWPFFLHEEYGEGISRENMMSFERCCIAQEQKFSIKNVEIWRVGTKPKLSDEEEEKVRKDKSVIDKDPEAKAIMEMSGRKMYSEAYREPEPLLDNE